MKIIGAKREMDRVQTVGESDYVKNGELHFGANARSVMVESEAQLAQLPEDLYEPGSMAFTAGFADMWQKAADGTWVSMTD